MPLAKYLILRKAAEIEEVSTRRILISDINAAFIADKNHIKNLTLRYNQLTQNEDLHRYDKNWEDKLKKYKR